MVDLHALAAAYEAAVPTLKYRKAGSRAQKAVEIVELNRVVWKGELPSGVDMWRVGDNEHEVSFIGRHCACEDAYAPVVEGVRVECGEVANVIDAPCRLCKHMLAVIFAMTAREEGMKFLAEMIRDAERMGAGQIMLNPRVWFAYGDGAQECVFAAYRIEGLPEIEIEEPFSFGIRDLQNVLLRANWRVESRTGGAFSGAREKWVIKPSDFEPVFGLPEEIAGTFRLYGAAADTRERQSREVRLRQMLHDAAVMEVEF